MTANDLKHVTGTKPDGQPSARPATRQILALLQATRPHQWTKNSLLLLPLLMSHQVGNLQKLTAGILAFIAMCFCSAGVYIFNDLLDMESDRRHPTKRLRPFASGRASVRAGIVLAVVALIAAFAISAMLLPWRFTALLALYLALTTAYSLWLKTRLLVDVMVLAGLYTLRIIAGAQAVDVPLTMWLLAFSMFVFLSLAFVKRYSELIEAEHLGGEEACGRNYRVSDLRIIEAVGPASGYLAVVVFCNYLNSDMVRNLYRHPQVLWLVAPLLLYWLTRVWFLARRRAMHEDAILFALRDRVSILTAVLSILVVMAAGPRAGIIVGAN
ncbi:MAG TPA: UbiA family prenyltransferase [Tepidisphaeraceae bacterium]|jgi:4-hydroxybenzoate polyprenyltransferase|nr:UbiA family prenyltransferase [Tepidisphaeraceae bacterium]